MILLVLLVVFGVGGLAAAEAPFEGRVVGVADGDTVTVLTAARESVKVRLHGVDAPERSQAFGQRAKQFTSTLVFGQTVRVEPRDRDRYGRLVARVRLADGRDLGLELVQAGLAWWYERYAKGERALAEAQAEARRQRRGLWQDPAPVPPWEYRRQPKPPKSSGGRT